MLADALEQNRQISSTAAQEALGQAVRGLEDKISSAANHMRLEAFKDLRQALCSFGGIEALGGRSGHRSVEREFGKRSKVFCTSAGGELITGTTGRRFYAFWVNPYVPVN